MNEIRANLLAEQYADYTLYYSFQCDLDYNLLLLLFFFIFSYFSLLRLNAACMVFALGAQNTEETLYLSIP
jgi:hypothetical protein